MNILSRLFSPSPFRFLQDHARETGTCLRRLALQFEAALSEDRSKVAFNFREIQARVLIGRGLVDEASRVLSRFALLPVPRQDFISTIDVQHQMLVSCGEIASIISARRLSLDDKIRSKFVRYVHEVLELSAMANDVTADANVFVGVCFEGSKAERIDTLIEELRLRATRAGLRRSSLLRTLFSKEEGVCSIDDMFRLHLLTEVGLVADLADRLASRFRLLNRPREQSPVHATRRAMTANSHRIPNCVNKGGAAKIGV